MIVEIKIPAAGESVTEAAIGNWLVEDGSMVERDQEIAEVETDKATLPLIAPESGKLKIHAESGKKVKIGDIACTIDTDASADKISQPPSSGQEKKTITTTPSAAAATSEEHMQQAKPDDPPVKEEKTNEQSKQPEPKTKRENPVKITPLAQSIMDQNDLDVDAIISGLKKITKHQVEQVIHEGPEKTQVKPEIAVAGGDEEERTPMSPLRRKLSKRLVAVKNETAMLTTFNEVDMSALLELRKKHQATFQEKFGLKLGMVSFFTMACTKALMQFPRVNSFIEGDDIITPHHTDIAIAVQTDKGLMVPVIRKTNTLTLAQIEAAINTLAEKARTSKLSIEEMTGGSFTITNGGVFGSMLSTPILNPPQSAILGMHNIVDRPVAINGKVVIKPIMYVALSYDHRLIDGRDSVSFLYKVKQFIESPVTMLLEGKDPEKLLLGI